MLLRNEREKHKIIIVVSKTILWRMPVLYNFQAFQNLYVELDPFVYITFTTIYFSSICLIVNSFLGGKSLTVIFSLF